MQKQDVVRILMNEEQFNSFEKMLDENPIEANEKLKALLDRQPIWSKNDE